MLDLTSIFLTAQNKTLWVTLAAISLKNDQLEISEEAYCASLQVDKVEYLQHIKVQNSFFYLSYEIIFQN